MLSIDVFLKELDEERKTFCEVRKIGIETWARYLLV